MYRPVAVVLTGALLIAACGGGDDVGDVLDEMSDAGAADAEDGGEGGQGGGGAFEGVGDAAAASGEINVVEGATATAEPGTAWIETDGQRFDYAMAGSIHLTCEVAPESVQVNIQSPDGQNLSIVMTDNAQVRTGSIAFSSSDSNVAYGADLLSGTFGVGENAVSYEGPIDRVVDYDIADAETIDGTIAVNCEPAGGTPTASIGGVDYTFPISGAQSFECTVTPEQFEIRINRLSQEGTQLEMQGRLEGDRWVGAIVVYTPEGNSVGQLPLDGTGLIVDGTSVTFDGTFDAPDGTQVSGTATAGC